MIPQKKAEEIVKAMSFKAPLFYEESIQCSIVAVDLILDALSFHEWQNQKIIDYYQQVKQEINKL